MLDVERDGAVLRVTLARPERRNAFDAALIARLHDAFSDVGDARAVVLTGEGPSFCAGADVDWQRASIGLSVEENVEDALRLYRMLAAVDRCPAPVIAGVHGYALGGGSGLAACADVVVAAPDAVFGFTEVRLGIAPAVISPFVLAKIGAQARRYFTTGERFDAEAALRIGLVHELADDVAGAVARIVREVLQSGPEAVRAAKSLALDEPADGEELARLAAGLRAGAEGQEGLRAFLEKREASWRR
jgi:enoyl-CoA hydratase/carnithine racemase